MANISDLSGDERDQRIAELKKKMQEAAAKRAQEQAGKADPTGQDALDTDAAPTVKAETAESAPPAEMASDSDAPQAAATETPVAEESATTDLDEDRPATEVAAAALETTADDAGSASVAALTASATGIPAKPEKTAEQKLNAEMNRREFLTYSWGAAMGLLLLGSGVATFQFMYPRFKAGEFGGAFLMGPESALPPTNAAPQAVPDGKFWWINVEEVGPRALYMVCTHLGCLYKWVDERERFECPCHGSKFTRDGLFIEGPAPRSLDHFVTEFVDNVWVVDTGAKVPGAPASESPAAGTG